MFTRDGLWLVDYGSYMCGLHSTRGEAIEKATDAALNEGRALVVELSGRPGAARLRNETSVRPEAPAGAGATG